MNIIPAITLYQPWATWIVRGWKTIETRTHNRFSCLKGKTILIHSGQKTDASAVKNPYLSAEQILENPDEFINGYIIGSAYVRDTMKLDGTHSQTALIDCQNVERFGLFLDSIKKFETPIPVKGQMGIWYFNMETFEKVKKEKINTQTLF